MFISIVSGGFDPLHSGHIEYFKSAHRIASKLIVGVNSDAWLIRKKGKFFLPLHERKIIVGSIKYVSEVVEFNDDDNSAADLIDKVASRFGGMDDKIFFCNGGDRNQGTSQSDLEHEASKKYKNVFFVYGVGGNDKLNSSSLILKRWENEKSINIRTDG